MQLKPGDRIDRYTLVAPIGGGGQGTIWKVLDPLDGGVERALKLVPTGDLSAEAFERARREARALASAPHPNLIACYGLFEDIGLGLVGLALELVDGKSAQEAAKDPRMTAEHRSALLLQLAEALAFVHSSEIVHRDLKPENILVTEAFWSEPKRPGTIKLVDFGIAIRVGNPRPLTQVGGIVGTAPYLAPEAIVPSVAPDAALGYTRDLFAYGVLAFELLLDRHPTGLDWDASPVQFVRAYAAAASGATPWPPAGLPPRWQEPIARCLAIDSAQRPASGIELLELLLGRMSDPTPLADPDLAERETMPAPPIATEQSSEDPPPRPSTVRDEPSTSRRTPASAALPRKRASGLGFLLITLLVLGAVGVVSAVRLGALVLPPWIPADLTRRIAGAPASVAEPEPSAVPADVPSGAPSAVSRSASSAPNACPAVCCGGTACAVQPGNARGCAPEGGHCRGCSSGRACVPGSCESRIPADGAWLLRVAGATVNGRDIYPRPEVCLRRSTARGHEPWACTPAGSADPRATRLRVTTTELADDGIDLSINRSPKGPSTIGKGVHQAGVGVAALCKGLNLRFVGRDHLAYAVTVFLDDADEGDGGAP